MASYLTINSPSTAKFTEKMSRFIGFAYPAQSVEEAKALMSGLQREYCDARHVCWAWVIGVDAPLTYSTDNGEPSGTAGKPILGQINSFGLTDIVIVVVRYFGGIKLGTSGLIVAYREAAREALAAADIIECHDMERIEFTFPYLAMNDVMRLTKSSSVEIIGQVFDNSCSMVLSIRADEADMLRSRLADIDGVTLTTD